MTADRCSREDELLDALGSGFVGAELDQHVASCAACADLRLVAGGLLDDRRDAMMAASIPSSGTMWFRIQLRLRRDAQSTARRSLVIGQAITVGVVLLLLGSLLGAQLAGGFFDVLASIRLSTPLLVAFILSLLVAPIAGYVAVRQK